VIAVAPGTYRETVRIPRGKEHLTLLGTGERPEDTVIVEGHASGMRKPDGSGTYGTMGSATVMVDADDFQAANLTIANDFDEAAHPTVTGHQAVALRTAADRVLLAGVVVEGDQDTMNLEYVTKERPSRVYVVGSRITGTVDFVFGGATVAIDRSVLRLKRRCCGDGLYAVTAPSTQAGRRGILITHSVVDGTTPVGSARLGRTWHAGSGAAADPQTTVRDTVLGAVIRSAPWGDMGGFSWREDRFAEYRNRGPGAGAASGDRPQLSDAEAADQEVADWLGDWTPRLARSARFAGSAGSARFAQGSMTSAPPMAMLFSRSKSPEPAAR
jgi:pectinesterase